MPVSNQEINNKDQIIGRTGILYFFFVFFALLIVGKIVYMQFIDYDAWQEKYEEISIPEIISIPERGDILDINGRVLATSIPRYNIMFDTGITYKKFESIFNKDVDSLAICLAALLKDKTAAQYLDYLKTAKKEKNRFLSIASSISREDYLKMKTFPIFRNGRYKGGFINKPVGKRKKPFGDVLSRTIGHLIEDEATGRMIGAAGLELNYNSELEGRDGSSKKKKIKGKVFMPVAGDDNYEDIPAKDVITSIDINLQDFAHKTLRDQLIESNADHGSLVIMEVKTGFIKAMVNMELTQDSSYVEKYNFAVGESLAPGSTFKLPVLVAALEEGFIKITDTIDTGKGYLTIGDYEISDPTAYGKLSVKNIVEKSSNVGMAKMVRSYFLGKEDKFIERLTALRLTDLTGIEIGGEQVPTMSKPGSKDWSGVTLAQMAIGYEVRFSPIQILTFYNAIANDGILVSPKLVKAFKVNGMIEEKIYDQTPNEPICSQNTLKQVKEVLESVVEHGTAKIINNPNYKIAGKTGTAKYWGEEKQTIVDEYRASFVGYFPADNPKYSCMVVINMPKGDYYGSMVAAPVFKKISDKLFAVDSELAYKKDKPNKNNLLPVSKNGFTYETNMVFSTLNIKTESGNEMKSDWIFTETGNKSVKFSENNIRVNIIPKVLGMGAKDAVFLLESLGLEVNIKGRGEVKKQSPVAGKIFTKGEKVYIELG